MGTINTQYLTQPEINTLKKHIFVYYIEPMNSVGVYLGRSKEEARKSILEEILDPLWEEGADVWNGTIDILSAISIWTWDEYQEIQGFNISDRLLEVANFTDDEEEINDEES